MRVGQLLRKKEVRVGVLLFRTADVEEGHIFCNWKVIMFKIACGMRRGEKLGLERGDFSEWLKERMRT